MTEQQKNRFLKAKRALFDKYYSFLNSEQREAIYTVNGPVLILAGAGSGKTTVLTNRVSHIMRYGNAYKSHIVHLDITNDDLEMLEDTINISDKMSKKELGAFLECFREEPCDPSNILAVTFTNKAANEIVERLKSIVDHPKLGDRADPIWVGTFHSICMRMLHSHGEILGYRKCIGICDTDDSKKLVSKCLKDLNIDEKKLPIKFVMNEISRAKDKLITPHQYASDAGDDFKYKQVAQVYDLYQKRLRNSNLVDFDDIIMQTVFLLQQNIYVLEHYQKKFKYIFVDEYQDTNYAQFMLIYLLAGHHKNIMVVGDDDQSIYKFRGATIENILSFDTKYPETKVVKLEQNYRSTSNILNAANSVIKNNPHKHPKELWCDNEEGDKIIVKEAYTQNDESRYIIDKIVSLHKERNLTYRDFAILYRMNAQSMNLETMFAKSGIPYRMLGALRFYDRKEVKDIIAYLSVINNPSDNVRLTRIVNEPKRGIGDASYDTASKIAEEIGVPTLKVLENAHNYNAIPMRAANSMVAFSKIMIGLIEDMDILPLSELVKQVIKRSGYEADLISKGQVEAERLENLDALCSAVKEYEDANEDASLSGFLEEVALISDIDKYDENADAVTLMTIHSSKGLEFPIVFLPGMEENVFPGTQSISTPGEIDEERRLAYVAITRAKKTLIITHAKERMLYGMTQRNPLSRFVREIDPKYLDIKKERLTGGTFVPRQEAIKQTNYGDSFKKPEKPKIVPFEIGDRIHHFTFGEGTVLNVIPMSSDFMYEIAFDRVGTKKLMATYVAKLMKKI